MSSKLRFALLLAVSLSLLLVLSVQAQEPRPTPTPAALAPESEEAQREAGSIRGTVFRDLNNDGLCGGEGEGPLAGVPVRFTSGDETIYLQSGENGTFGLVAAGLGYWEVAAEPSAAQGVVTSTSPRGVQLSADDQLAVGVDFCIGSTRPAQVILPESGAPAMPGLWLFAAVGLLLLVAGAILQLRSAFWRG